MFWPTHIVTGLIIGKLTGNYPISIIASILPDLDHLWIYYKHDVLFNRDLFKTLLNDKDEIGEQRNYLHSIFIFAFLSFCVWYFLNSVFIPFFIGYFIHMVLDSLDKSEMRPFYPFRFKTTGFIGYLSKAELLLFAGLIIIYFII